MRSPLGPTNLERGNSEARAFSRTDSGLSIAPVLVGRLKKEDGAELQCYLSLFLVQQ